MITILFSKYIRQAFGAAILIFNLICITCGKKCVLSNFLFKLIWFIFAFVNLGLWVFCLKCLHTITTMYSSGFGAMLFENKECTASVLQGQNKLKWWIGLKKSVALFFVLLSTFLYMNTYMIHHSMVYAYTKSLKILRQNVNWCSLKFIKRSGVILYMKIPDSTIGLMTKVIAFWEVSIFSFSTIKRLLCCP